VNSPTELPRMGEVIAGLRGIEPAVLAQATTASALAVLPRLAQLVPVAP
jgi:TatD DNase family protein